MLHHGPTFLSSISHVLTSLSGQFPPEVTRWPPAAPASDSPSLAIPENMRASLQQSF